MILHFLPLDVFKAGTYLVNFMSVNPPLCLPSLKQQLSEMGRCLHVAKSYIR